MRRASDALLADDLVVIDAADQVFDEPADFDLHRIGTFRLSRLAFS